MLLNTMIGSTVEPVDGSYDAAISACRKGRRLRGRMAMACGLTVCCCEVHLTNQILRTKCPSSSSSSFPCELWCCHCCVANRVEFGFGCLEQAGRAVPSDLMISTGESLPQTQLSQVLLRTQTWSQNVLGSSSLM